MRALRKSFKMLKAVVLALLTMLLGGILLALVVWTKGLFILLMLFCAIVFLFYVLGSGGNDPF